MRIVRVETTLFREAGSVPDRDSGAQATHTLIELSTDDGLTGIATASPVSERAVHALARDVLTGADPRSAMGLWERMGGTVTDPTDLAAARARAALDIAMWDLKAKANEEPLWKTLGGKRPAAKAHLSWDGPADIKSMVNWFRHMCAETGIRSASIPASADPAGNLQCLAEVQAALRATVPQSALMLHFDGRGWAGDAIRHIRALERRFDLTWVRSPVRRGDFRGARRVMESVATAVCIGYGLSSTEAYLPYLQHYAANVLELDVGVLGISGCIQMADAAFGLELPVALSAHTGHLAVHLFSALPTRMSIEIGYRAWASTACSTDVTFDNGLALAGDWPGNGLAFDRAALASAAKGTGAP